MQWLLHVEKPYFSIIFLFMHTLQKLTRQVNEYRDALKFANRSCEQLEQKLEESELDNKELKLKCTKKDVTLQVKTKIIEDLQNRIEALDNENTQLQDELKTRKLDSVNGVSSTGEPVSPGRIGRSHSYAGFTKAFEPSVSELQEVIDDLTMKLQNANYQKNKLQQTVDNLSSENTKLDEFLTKNESDIIDLQMRNKYLEELLGEFSEPVTPLSSIPPPSPSQRHIAIQSLSNTPGHAKCPTCSNYQIDTNISYVDENVSSSVALSVSSRVMTSESSHSSTPFHTELQNEFCTLQNNFDRLVKECQCPASLPFKDIQFETPPPTGDGTANIVISKDKEHTNKQTLSSSGKLNQAIMDTSLKDLFEEVYSTLKQTTVVADQLLERRRLFK